MRLSTISARFQQFFSGVLIFHSFLLIIVLMLGLINSCGEKEDSESPGLDPLPTSVSGPDNFPHAEGWLELVPSDFALNGMVKYRFYADGLIYYEGNVTYFGSEGILSKFFSPYYTTFRGTYKADKKTLLSSTYAQEDQTHEDFRLNFFTDEIAKISSTVNVEVKDNPATAEIVIDRRERVIEIVRATVVGKVFGQDVTLELRRPF